MGQETKRDGVQFPERDGVQFPERDGRRSSIATGRRIFAAAARSIDERLASSINSTDNWRKGYMGAVRSLVEAGIGSGDDATLTARAGLQAAQGELTFVRGDETSIADALSTFREETFHTATIEGNERGGIAHLSIPYRGETLAGDDLQRQLDKWERDGVIEPSCTQAIREVLASPGWLDLSDLQIAMLGAASEMGPLTSLCSWGATVLAVDLPSPSLWRRVVEVARGGRGRLIVPTRVRADDPEDLCNNAGADLLTQAPEVRTWLAGFDGPLTVGNYVYAHGGNFVCLAAAVDALIEDLSRERADLSVAYLATPTDVYAVPSEMASAAVARRPLGIRNALHAIVRTATRHRLYSPNYGKVIADENGRSWGISDCLVPQQGANYALAKALQRWRAIVARDAGHVSSANLAPATLTRSVVRNRVLAAAYAGAPGYGVEIFEPATSSALMATLLVHDLRNSKAAANPEMQLQHPYQLWTDSAAHGGLLRLPYEPRSVLPLAALRGLLKRRSSP
ncbi:MAG: hypothetical protein M3124_07535 [Actinomycetota bacterium]|nr:hypothetical protein [Actinomycetota bacterium]